jgi:hypothetical protein
MFACSEFIERKAFMTRARVHCGVLGGFWLGNLHEGRSRMFSGQ